MKAIVVSLLAASTLHAAESVADFRWKKRLLVVTQSDEALAKKLTAAKPGLAERDVEVFVLNGQVGPGRRPGDELTKSLRGLLKLESATEKDIFLLGKDGRTAIRWTRTEFSTEVLFASIDAMPMRRREMNGK